MAVVSGDFVAASSPSGDWGAGETTSPAMHQRASHRADGLTIWDYHVICIQKNKEAEAPFQVWDVDSSLPFPSPLSQYVSKAIQPSFQVYPEYQSMVHAPIFVRNFASNRRHMKDSAGIWIAQPPTYDPIISEDGTVHNLDDYIKISSAEVTDIRDNLLDRILSENFGGVVGERHLEYLFSQFSK